MVALRPVVFAGGLLLLLLLAPQAAAYQERPTVTVYEIQLHEDGDATWNVELRYQLDSEEQVEDFRDFKQSYESGETNASLFEGVEQDVTALVAEASEATGREMEATGFEREVTVEETLTGQAGVTALEFTWTNFVSGNRMGDVFQDGGLVLAPDQRLVVTYPDSVEVGAVTPDPDSRDEGKLIWEGERFFEDGNPSVVLSEPTGSNEDEGFDLSAASLALVVLVLLSGFGGGVLVSRRFDVGLERTNGESKAEVTEVESMGEDVDEELLTDRDRIVHLLRENGGRMKQADIVAETGWSKSKVSMVLSDMEEEDAVSKLRLGRENVIDLENGDLDDG